MCASRAQFGQSGDVSSHDAYNGASSDANSVNFSMVEEGARSDAQRCCLCGIVADVFRFGGRRRRRWYRFGSKQIVGTGHDYV